MNRTGETETLSLANGLSLPRGERPIPITLMLGSTAFSASYPAASSGSYAAPEAAVPFELNCGCQKRGWFGSFPATKTFTYGHVRASCWRKAANCAIAAGEEVTSRGCAGETAKMMRIPWIAADGIQ